MSKISQYTEVTTNTTNDVFICNQSGSTMKTTLAKIANAIFGSKTDNNLPHYTGTPTAGTTADAIGAKADSATSITNIATFSIGASSSKTITVTPDGNSNVSFLVVGIGRNVDLNPIYMHIGGYVSANRTIITNITGKTGLSIDNSNTTSLVFTFSNTKTTAIDTIRLIPLLENTFTVS